MNKKEIPIALSADNNYALPMCVTIVSIVKHAKKDTKYQFFIFVPDDFHAFYKKKIQDILHQHEMNKAVFVTMADAYDDVKMNIGHITKATYYRLKLPSILSAYDKCLYLDVDIAVCADLSELYQVDLSDDYIAGIKAAAYYYPVENQIRQAERLEIEKLDRYVNAGVLVINLAKMRKDNLEQRFEALLEKDYPAQDQDILNAACYPYIKVLEPKYNLMTKYPILTMEEYQNSEALKICFEEHQWKEAMEHPVIIHYADTRKPWLYMDCQKAEAWWEANHIFCMENENDNQNIEAFWEFYKFTQDRHAQKETETEEKMQAKLERTLQDKNVLADNFNTVIGKKKKLEEKVQILQQEQMKKEEAWNARNQRSVKEKQTLKNKIEKKNERIETLRNRTEQLKYSVSAERKKNQELQKELQKYQKHSPVFQARRVYRKLRLLAGKTVRRLLRKVVIFDVSLDTDNLGDEIIMHYCNMQIKKIWKGYHSVYIPTHRPPTAAELKKMRFASYKIVCGTNIICPDVEKYSLWKLPEDKSQYRDIILMGAGWNSDLPEATPASRKLYKKILNRYLFLSIRDQYSTDNMKKMGFHRTLNTNCVTMWNLTKEHCREIPKEKADKVVFTLTAHRKKEDRDRCLVDTLLRNYKQVYFWPQGDKDSDYLMSHYADDRIKVLDRTLTAYHELLAQGNIDYVGTRLHGGIYALNQKIRTIVIEVDNRAREIGKDTNLPCIKSEDVAGKLEEMICSQFATEIHLNEEQISKWVAQFE